MTESTQFAVDVAEALGWTEHPFIAASYSGEVIGVHARRFSRWHPDTDANDDYEVLEAVRKWPIEKRRIFHHFMTCRLSGRIPWEEDGCLYMQYQIGDYARAALAVAKKEK